MIPSLSPLSDQPSELTRVPPPPYFHPIEGRIVRAETATLREFEQSGTAAQRAGMRYERKVHEHLRGVLGSGYRANQPFKFVDQTGVRFAVPDGLLLSGKNIFVFEIKFQHMPEAWWQLRQLYEPIIRFWNRDATPRVVEICRSFDPAVPFPEPVRLIDSLTDYIDNPFEEFAVLRWK